MNGEPVAKAPGVASALSVMAAIAKVGVFAGDTNLYAINFLYNQWRPSWRRQTCPRTSRPVIVRLGMMTVHKCQAVVVAGRWRNPRGKLIAIIVASVWIDRPQWSIKSGLQPEAILLSGDATFLHRLLIGWNRSSVVKLVPFREKERTNVCDQRICLRLDAGRASLPETSSWTSARRSRYHFSPLPAS